MSPVDLTCSERDELNVAIEEGVGEATAEDARDVWVDEPLPSGEPEIARERANEVEWIYIADGEATGAVTVRLQSWGLWHLESIVRCV